MNQFDLAIVGAGASGLAAAITAGRAMIAGGCHAAPTSRVVLLERLPRAGKKILVTGNGRCNLSNRAAPAHPYHNNDFAAPALRRFGAAECEAFFASLGLALREDAEGRFYPRSNTAASVLDALRFGAARAGVEIRCDYPITEIKQINDGFLLNESIQARNVIISTGGCAAPAQGSDGSGLALLRNLGHTIIEPKPALVQILCASPLLGMLKGLRVHAEIQVAQARAQGEILFAGDGLSGIAAMEVSRAAQKGSMAVLDLLPDYSHEELYALLARWRAACPDYDDAQLLAGLMPKRVAEAVVKSGQDCKRFRFPVTGTRSFAHAQVTAGGADVREFDPLTMQSRLVPGLYACGEVLDVDGGCGGFNLHWAWASGVLAGSI